MKYVNLPRASSVMLFTLTSVLSFGVGAETQALETYEDAAPRIYTALMNTGELGATDVLAEAEIYDSAPNQFMPTVENAPWAANYFPMVHGGIASRWQGVKNDYTLLSVGPEDTLLSLEETREKVLSMSFDEIAALSPTEKYDIMRGDYSFSTTRWELLHRGPERKPSPQGWEGFCNAMRAAGSLSDEPVSAITLTNADGVAVELQPADVKALFGATYFYVEKYAALGSPHHSEGLDTDPPNPAALHTALNVLALRGHFPMIIDMKNRGSEIWNETVVGYSRVMQKPRNMRWGEKRNAPQGASKIIEVSLELRALAEIDMQETNGRTQARVAAGQLGINRLSYRYKLFVDDEGRTLEGKWVGKEWPDFVWFPNGRGADANFGGNPFLDYDTVKAWADASANGSR